MKRITHLQLVTNAMNLGNGDDEKIQVLIDQTAGAALDRLDRLIESNLAYGASMEQLTADRMRVCEPPEEVARLVDELVAKGRLVKRTFTRSSDVREPEPETVTLYFHCNHRDKIEVTRVTFHLAAVA